MTEYDTAPLARYKGARPPTPQWFLDAVAVSPARSWIPLADRRIELLSWGEVGKPGLLFLHGMSAHADWWSFIAPFFARDWRCAAISFSGMGGSDWSDVYTFDRFGEEAAAAIDAAGLDASGQGVISIGHSFGGHPAMLTSARDDRVRGVICIDTAISPHFGQPPARPPSRQGHRVYAEIADALARFRLDPLQRMENHYVIDHIARNALKPVDGGWMWRFDPALWNLLDRGPITTHAGRVRCPMVYMHGEKTKLINDDILAYMREALPSGTPIFAIPDADHHVLADQPLALVAALRGVLSCWPPTTRI